METPRPRSHTTVCRLAYCILLAKWLARNGSGYQIYFIGAIIAFGKRVECMQALVCLSIDRFVGVEPYCSCAWIYLVEVEQIDRRLAKAAVFNSP